MGNRFNIIGDIHGRDCWKDLVDPDRVNVFVGDYFDPYGKVSVEDMVDNFKNILEFKKQHPETVLLYGNHDFHYIVPEYAGTTSRYNRRAAELYRELFEESAGLFTGVAFAAGEKHLVSHAGVTQEWFDRWLKDAFSEDRKASTEDMERLVNRLWREDPSAFAFENNAVGWDLYGDSRGHSPIWVRPGALSNDNYFKGTDIVQIVGHTQIYSVTDLSGSEGIVLVDCLGYSKETYKFDA